MDAEVEVSAVHSDPCYTDDVLSVDAFCFQGCTYHPFEP